MSHKHSESRNFTPFKAVPFSPEKCQRFHFVHSFTCMVAGMTGSGKTVWVQSLLQQAQNVIEPPPERIIWCYSQWQPAYSELLNTVPNIEFVKGIRKNLEQDSYFDDNKSNLIVIDSSIGDGGFGAFLRNSAQTEPAPYTTFPSNGFYILCSHWKTI